MTTSGEFRVDPLFLAVQRARVFADSKTFVDCVPTQDPRLLASEYERIAGGADRPDLRAFVARHYLLPEERHPRAPAGMSVERHVDALWKILRREPDLDVPHGSLLPLPHAYVVPGGRFREVYYWDTYFTMLGLVESGEGELARCMVENFAHLIRRHGFVPNGNRSYYLSRSQPPFFALMVELLAARVQPDALVRHLEALEFEHAFWTRRDGPASRAIELPGLGELSHYSDACDEPRPEAFAEDEAWARESGARREGFYRDVRAAAESGWDFSSRWFRDGLNAATIATTEMVPVDLNCLLYQLERTLAEANAQAGRRKHRDHFLHRAQARRRAIAAACWSEREEFFCDYDSRSGRTTGRVSLAGVMPLFVQIATPAQAAKVSRRIERDFLRAGGVVTTLRQTGQQWDAPNGWAPLQWCTIRGLEHYGHDALAAEIARRWIKLNCDLFARTGRLMEKYDVVDLTRAAGGGEYPNQDGFGWTNGVLRALMVRYPRGPRPPANDRLAAR